MPAPKALFKPVVPGEAVATLILIENSQPMINGWSDLRDHHLPTLLGTMRLANPIVPIQVLWLISSPVNDDDNSPANYDKELPDIRFDLRESNKISVALIDRGINLLVSTLKGQPAARHLILVAASSPTEDANAPGWQQLAVRMQNEKIFLHVVLNPAQHMEAIGQLFYNSLARQNHQEIVPWFPADTTMYRFHLAGTASISAPREAFVNREPSMSSPPSQVVGFPPPFFRNHTYPLDAADNLQAGPSDQVLTSPPAEFARPSLVTRLQKIHGLTRKKKYGAQPTIQPFLREDRTQPPTPLSIPSLSSPASSPSAEARIPAKSKVDRARRQSTKGPLATSPTEPNPPPQRRGSWFRRKSRAVVPDDIPPISHASSPTSGSSHSPNSPPLPTPLDSDPRTVIAASPVSSPWEPSWLRHPTDQADGTFPAYEQGPSSPSYFGYPSMPTSYGSGASPLAMSGNDAASGPTSPVIDDGDQPFILSPEYEAAATARFHAIFNTSARTDIPDFTSMNNYFNPGPSNPRQSQYTYPNVDTLSLTPHSSSYFGLNLRHPSQDAGVISQTGFPPDQTPSEDSYGSVGTSSLEGWDGRFYPM